MPIENSLYWKVSSLLLRHSATKTLAYAGLGLEQISGIEFLMQDWIVHSTRIMTVPTSVSDRLRHGVW